MSEIDLKRFELLSHLTDSDREVVADLLEPVELATGRQLFREGQEAEGLILVEEGELRLERRSGETGICGAGTALGGLSLLAIGAREITAVATAPTRVLQLSRSNFLRLAEDFPRTGLRLIEAIVADVASALREGLDAFAPRSG